MLIRVDSRGNKYLSWAKAQLQSLTQLRKELKLPVLKRHFIPETGFFVRIVSSEWRDEIYITGTKEFDYLVMVLKSAVDNHDIEWELWGAQQNNNGVWEAIKTTPNLTTTANPFSGNQFQSEIFDILPIRDKEHGGSFWSLLTYARGAGITPQDNHVQTTNAQPLDANFVVGVGSGHIYKFGPEDEVLDPDGFPLSYSFDIAAYEARVAAIYSPAANWDPTSFAPEYLPSRDNTLLVFSRPRKNNLGVTSIPEARTLYVETYHINSYALTPGGTVDDVLIRTNTFAGTEERYYFAPVSGIYHVHRAHMGELSSKQFSFEDHDPSPNTVRGPIVGNPSEPNIPRAFNDDIIGYSINVVLIYPAPKKIMFGGITLHDDLSDAPGFPYFCNVWPAAIRIEENQYFHINTFKVKSNLKDDDNDLLPTSFEYADQHDYRWGNFLIKNDVLVASSEETRMYSGNEGGSDTFLQTDPVMIYVPCDGVRYNGEDWFCGIRVEQYLDLAAFPIPSRTLNIGIRIRPALWKVDKSEIITYPSLEQDMLVGVHGTLNDKNMRSNFGNYNYFAKFRGEMFFVFTSGEKAVNYNIPSYAVPMSARNIEPILLSEDLVEVRLAASVIPPINERF